jgi:hypothetical protein
MGLAAERGPHGDACERSGRVRSQHANGQTVHGALMRWNARWGPKRAPRPGSKRWLLDAVDDDWTNWVAILTGEPAPRRQLPMRIWVVGSALETWNGDDHVIVAFDREIAVIRRFGRIDNAAVVVHQPCEVRYKHRHSMQKILANQLTFGDACELVGQSLSTALDLRRLGWNVTGIPARILERSEGSPPPSTVSDRPPPPNK